MKKLLTTLAALMLLCCLPLLALAEETVLMDNDVARVLILDYGVDESRGPRMGVEVANRTDKRVRVYLDDCIADGYVNPCLYNLEVEPGQTSTAYAYWLQGETVPTALTFTVRVVELEEFSTIAEQPCTVYPMGEENVVMRTYTPDEDDVVLYDSEEFSVIWTGLMLHEEFGGNMYLHLENKTDKTLELSIEECMVDGYVNDPYWYESLPAGLKMLAEVNWYDMTQTPGTIDFLFRAYDYAADWDEPDLISERFVIYPMGEENAVQAGYTPSDTDVILVDDEKLLAVVTDWYVEEFVGACIEIYLENRMDVVMEVEADDCMVEGFMDDPYWSVELPAGGMAKECLSWSDWTEVPTRIEFTLKGRTYEDDYDAPTVRKACAIYPYGEENVAQFTYTPDENDVTFVDTEDLLVVMTNLAMDNNAQDVCLYMYVENRSDAEVQVGLRNAVADGYLNDPHWQHELLPGAKQRSVVRWYQYGRRPDMIRFDVEAVKLTDGMADGVIARENILIYPTGREFLRADPYTPSSTDILLLETEELTIYLTGARTDDFWSYVTELHLQSWSEGELKLSVSDGRLNGQEAMVFWSCTLPAGACSREQLEWAVFSDMDEVSEIVLHLVIEDEAGNIVLAQPLTANP